MNLKEKPMLILLPNVLIESLDPSKVLGADVGEAVASLDGLICESEKAGRRYLSSFNTKKPPREIPIAVYNKNSDEGDIDFFLEPIRAGERWGLLSDAGLPCIADPGNQLVARARATGIVVQAFSGPCSFVHALLLSGLPGQSFSFHGYLPKEPDNRKVKLLQIEKKSQAEQSTQIFMETPYRNQHLLQTALEILNPATLFCAAWNLTAPSQGVICQMISQWKKMALPHLEKKPAIFLLLAKELQQKQFERRPNRS